MKINTRVLAQSGLLLALAVAVQQFKIQWLTGPAINAILILAVGYSGLISGLIIGLITPLLAFTQGIMPLAIVIPFIMAGNAFLCFGFHWFKKMNSLLGLVMGALLKFSVLAFSVNFIINVPPKVAHALSTPQLITALTGGVIALIILKYLPVNKE